MITFKQFLVLEDSRGHYGEYVNDVAEKTMIHRLINLFFSGAKTEKNFEAMYRFIEAPSSEAFYEKYYDAFAEYAESHKEQKLRGKMPNLSQGTAALLKTFGADAHAAYKAYKASEKKD